MSTRIHLAIAVMGIALSACAQPKEDPRVAELQKELATMKQDLAANKDAQAGAAAGQASAAASTGRAIPTRRGHRKGARPISKPPSRRKRPPLPARPRRMPACAASSKT